MSSFILPRLQKALRLVDRDGTPALTFLRWFNMDFAGAIERQEAAQAGILADILAVQAEQAAQAAEIIAINDAQQDEIDRLNRVLAGTEAFTGLNVGGTNVKPFLDKTDGSALTDADGLDDALVSTAKIADEAVTVVEVDFNATVVPVTTTAEATLLTVPVTVLAGEKVDLQGIVDVFTVSTGTPLGNVSGVISIMLYRDSTKLLERAGMRAIKGIVVSLTCPTSWTDEPTPGPYNYSLRVKSNVMTDIATLEFSNAHLTATRIKR